MEIIAAIGAPTAVVIGAVLGALTGVAGAAVNAALMTRSQRRERNIDRINEREERYREEMVRSAADLSAALRWIGYRLVFIHIKDLESLVPQLDERLGEAQAQLGRVSLFFGPKSASITKAEGAYLHATQAIPKVRQLADLPVEEREGHPLGGQIGREASELMQDNKEFAVEAGAAIAAGSPWFGDR